MKTESEIVIETLRKFEVAIEKQLPGKRSKNKFTASSPNEIRMMVKTAIIQVLTAKGEIKSHDILAELKAQKP